MNKFIVTDISQLITNTPLFQNKKIKKIKEEDLGIIEGAWLVINDGIIEAYGTGEIPKYFNGWRTKSAENSLVTPGLVDAHTHAIFAGSRAQEFAQKLNGKTYQEIAASGGGILSSVAATRQADDSVLKKNLIRNLNAFWEWGVTTVEVKTGYGLSIPEELRLLRIIKNFKAEAKQNLYVTCLALHGLAPPFTEHKIYAEACRKELLPILVQENLADAVDAFIDKGYFTVEDCTAFFQDASRLGLQVRVHADEFSDSGASIAGVRWGAKSIDHTQYINKKAIEELSESETVAILLPGTSLYSKIPFGNARTLIDQNCAVAIATDFNPGSCRISNLPLIATMAALHCGMTCAEVFAAVTFVPAFSLGLAEKCGHLTPGSPANFVIHSVNNLDEWVADCGQSKPSYVHN